jgi:hypothetical protein
LNKKTFLVPSILVFAVLTLAPIAKAEHFPCEGGTGDIYCSGYHAGAVQADDDYNNHGFIDQAKHPCKSMAEFCAGYSKGYEDEADFYAQ